MTTYCHFGMNCAVEISFFSEKNETTYCHRGMENARFATMGCLEESKFVLFLLAYIVMPFIIPSSQARKP